MRPAFTRKARSTAPNATSAAPPPQTLTHLLWYCPNPTLAKARADHDPELDALPIGALPQPVLRGVAPEMSAIPETTFWGSDAHAFTTDVMHLLGAHTNLSPDLPISARGLLDDYLLITSPIQAPTPTPTAQPGSY